MKAKKHFLILLGVILLNGLFIPSSFAVEILLKNGQKLSFDCYVKQGSYICNRNKSQCIHANNIQTMSEETKCDSEAITIAPPVDDKKDAQPKQPLDDNALFQQKLKSDECFKTEITKKMTSDELILCVSKLDAYYDTINRNLTENPRLRAATLEYI
ncbi:MAG: hypothetical protein HQK99_01840 [Nitrospirae bacterium]|nr:hypothetical protein [Nitrospirota bacterium]